MKLAIPKERRPSETRVAASPDTVKRIRSLGVEVAVESGAGEGASIPDQAFADAGARIVSDATSLLADADIILKVSRPLEAADSGAEDTTCSITGMPAPSTPMKMMAFDGDRYVAWIRARGRGISPSAAAVATILEP